MEAVLGGVAHATVRERFTINLLSDGKIRRAAVSVYTDLILWYNYSNNLNGGGIMTDTEISRYMALLLRHKPEIAGLVLDKQGWADVDMLLKCISENMEPVSFERLCEIVKNDRK